MYKLLTFLDIAIFFVVLIITVGAVLYYRKKHPMNSAIEYMVMSRQLTLPLFVATLVATWYGGIFGVTSIAYKHGIYNFITQGLFWYIGYVFFALVIVPKLSKYKALSYPEMIGKITDKTAMRVIAMVMFFKILPVTYAISMGVFLNTLFGIDFAFAMLLGVLFVFCYSSFTGFRGIVISDFIQFAVMFIAVISVVVVSFLNYGGYSFLVDNLPETYFQITGNHDYQTVFIWLFLAISTIVTSPVFYQRCFACPNVAMAKRGILISVGFWFVFDLCTTLGGMYAYAVMPNLDSAIAYLTYAMDILPSGFKGLFLAGVLATICSTFDSFMFINKSIISYDIFKNTKMPKKVIYASAVMISYGLTIVMALSFAAEFEKIWFFIKGYTFASVVVPLMLMQLLGVSFSGKEMILNIVISITCMSLNDWLAFWEVKSFYVGCLCSFSVSMLVIFSRNIVRKTPERVLN